MLEELEAPAAEAELADDEAADEEGAEVIEADEDEAVDEPDRLELQATTIWIQIQIHELNTEEFFVYSRGSHARGDDIGVEGNADCLALLLSKGLGRGDLALLAVLW